MRYMGYALSITRTVNGLEFALRKILVNEMSFHKVKVEGKSNLIRNKDNRTYGKFVSMDLNYVRS